MMADGDTINESIVDGAQKPASSTIEGNTIVNRPLTDLVNARDAVDQRKQAKGRTAGVRRSVHRHQGPAGGRQ